MTGHGSVDSLVVVVMTVVVILGVDDVDSNSHNLPAKPALQSQVKTLLLTIKHSPLFLQMFISGIHGTFDTVVVVKLVVGVVKLIVVVGVVKVVGAVVVVVVKVVGNVVVVAVVVSGVNIGISHNCPVNCVLKQRHRKSAPLTIKHSPPFLQIFISFGHVTIDGPVVVAVVVDVDGEVVVDGVVVVVVVDDTLQSIPVKPSLHIQKKFALFIDTHRPPFLQASFASIEHSSTGRLDDVVVVRKLAGDNVGNVIFDVSTAIDGVVVVVSLKADDDNVAKVD